MSKLLELVNQFIGDLLQGNVFNNSQTYLSHIYKPVAPIVVPQSNAQDTRPLNLSVPLPEHPHDLLSRNECQIACLPGR